MSNPSEMIADYFEIPVSWAKVYYQLLKAGSGTIGQVISPPELDINRQQVYNILDKLLALDLVTIISQSKRGNVYMANSLETVTKNYIHKLENSLLKKQENQSNFVSELTKLLKLEDSPSIHDTSFQGQIIPKDNLAETITELIDQTIRTFKIAIKDVSMGIMQNIQPAVKKALDRESTVIHLLFDKKIRTEQIQKRFMDGSWFNTEQVMGWIKNGRLQIRFSDHLNQNFFLFDDIIFLLVFSGIEDVDFSFVTRVDQITHRFKHKYDSLFSAGEKLNNPHGK